MSTLASIIFTTTRVYNRKMTLHKILFVSAFLSPLFMFNAAHAAKDIETCQKLHADEISTESMSRCLDGVISYVDRELQTWVNLHTFNLEEKALVSGRYSALKMFKRSQSDFIAFRNNDCRWQYLAISPKQGADIAYKKCYILVTQSRIHELSMVP